MSGFDMNKLTIKRQGKATGPRPSLDTLIEEAKEIARKGIAKAGGPGACQIGYSAGKDGVVVAHLVQELGVRDAIMDNSFSFPKVTREAEAIIKKTMPKLNLIKRAHLTYEWLAKNRVYLDRHIESAVRQRFCAHRQHKTMELEARIRGKTLTFTGRRRNTNTLRSPLYVKKKTGRWQCHPLADWHDEDIWNYMKRVGIPRPFLYDTRFGELFENAPWIAVYDIKPLSAAFDMAAEVDPAVLREAAPYLPEVAAYLKARG